MTANFDKLAQSLQTETRDGLFKREIKEQSAEIAKQLKDRGVYENPSTGLTISIS